MRLALGQQAKNYELLTMDCLRPPSRIVSRGYVPTHQIEESDVEILKRAVRANAAVITRG
jgi:hypothetical protein